ncbi:MAG TPA: long-chain fatty acid--CoA ligase [Gaiellaceae bacterium]|nr:long-chain fatty acid--CoA ligase [Gaiellaceae bacterium]
MSDLHTIDRWIRDRATRTPDRVAIDYQGREVSYAELDARSDALAGGLAHGEVVSTLTGNSPEHVALMFACAKAGAILHPVSWRLAPAEVAFQLDDAGSAVLWVEEEHAELASKALELASVSPRELVSDTLKVSDTRPSDADGLLLIYTSGTTGRPKGALLTQANCYWTNLSFDLATGVGGDDVVLACLPQFHCGGWNVQPLLAWWKGAKVVLERQFEAARALRLIEEQHVTTMMGVPANYLFMAHEPGFATADLSSLRCCVVGGAPMPVPLLELWRERGVEIVQGYGLTEASPNVLCLSPEDAMRKIGSAGKAYPYVEIEVGPDDELLVRGPNVFPGYWRNPEATAATLAGGWLHTGDVVEIDDEGFVTIRGRLKEMFISGGENVYPAEIESVLHDHPRVQDVAVVGVPDETWGEVGVAFVVAGGEVTEHELVGFCRERLARFKVPKSVHFVDSLPRNSLGKIQKSELRAPTVVT